MIFRERVQNFSMLTKSCKHAGVLNTDLRLLEVHFSFFFALSTPLSLS